MGQLVTSIAACMSLPRWHSRFTCSGRAICSQILAPTSAATVLAAGGCDARVVAVEPDASARAALAKNVRLNALSYQVSVDGVILGASGGERAFSTGQDTTNHVLSESDGSHRRVRQSTADLLFVDERPLAMIARRGGYEAAVLAGARVTLADPRLKSLVVELNGSGSRYGFDDHQTHRSLLQCGFTAYSYDPMSRLLVAQGGISGQNTIYVRDPDWVRYRLNTAPSFKVFNREVA
jgi:FkbM family methyltransferase